MLCVDSSSKLLRDLKYTWYRGISWRRDFKCQDIVQVKFALLSCRKLNKNYMVQIYISCSKFVKSSVKYSSPLVFTLQDDQCMLLDRRGIIIWVASRVVYRSFGEDKVSCRIKYLKTFPLIYSEFQTTSSLSVRKFSQRGDAGCEQVMSHANEPKRKIWCDEGIVCNLSNSFHLTATNNSTNCRKLQTIK